MTVGSVRATAMSMAAFARYGPFALAALAAFGTIWGQPAPLPKLAPDRLADVKRKLESTRPIDITAERALAYSRLFLESASKAQRAGKAFQAERLADAADAMIHIAEHQEHLRNLNPPKGPLPAESVTGHLQHVYFRVQQADYFLKQSLDSRVSTFPKWARDFYQLAVRGHERGDEVAADENAKCAEEVVKCLEDLAQAATMTGPLPPLPPHPSPPPPEPPR